MTITIPAQYETLQTRAATVEELNTRERVIDLRAVPYGVETRLGPHLLEVFAPRAFAHATKDPKRVTLWSGHSNAGGSPVGRSEIVEDKTSGVLIRARVSETRAGDELLTLAQDGVLSEASVEFQPIREDMAVTMRGEDTLVRHRRAWLTGVALVPHGAYGEGARVLSVRDAVSSKLREEILLALRARIA